MDIPRLVTNTIAFLGVEAASKRIVAVLEKRDAPDDPAQMIFLLRKRPFSAMESMEVMEGHGWKELARPVLVPGQHADQPWADLFAARKSLSTVIAEHERRIDPVFDDSPFYFAIERPWGVPYYMRVALGALVMPVAGLLGVFVLFGKPRGERVAPCYAGHGSFLPSSRGRAGPARPGPTIMLAGRGRGSASCTVVHSTPRASAL